jgi:hypothetical protein
VGVPVLLLVLDGVRVLVGVCVLVTDRLAVLLGSNSESNSFLTSLNICLAAEALRQ